MENVSSRRAHPFETWLPWLVLLFMGFQTLATFVFVPYTGFDVTHDQIVSIYLPDSPGDDLKIGDRLIQVGSVRWEDFLTDRWQTVFHEIHPGESVPIQVERDGRLVDIAWIYPGLTWAQLFENLMGLWWLPFVFWLAGTSTLLFIRPRNAVWKLLIAFNYLTAVMLLAASGPSRWHILGGAVILHVAAWMFAPVSLHLNWLFPHPLARSPDWVWWLLYSLAAGMALLDIFSLIPMRTYMIGLVIGGAGIILLSLAHVILQPAYRKFITPLAIGVVIAIVPPLLVLLRDLLRLPTSPAAPGVTNDLGASQFIYPASALGLAALPGIYFYSVYILQLGGPDRRIRRLVRIYLGFILFSASLAFFFAFFFTQVDLGLSSATVTILLFGLAVLISVIGFFPLLALPALRSSGLESFPGEYPHLRPNRLVSFYLFVVTVLGIVGSLIFLLSLRQDLPYPVAIFFLAVTILVSVFTVLAYPRFQQFVDRRILGLPIPPTHLVEAYSSRITTSLDPASLVSLLRDELLPGLLVRQSALYQTLDGRLVPLYEAGLSESELLSDSDLPGILDAAGSPLTNGQVASSACSCPWARVIFPLQVEDHLVGIWLLGGRDPDDSYEAGELTVLQSIANQTAIALVNIQQSEWLHALYQADIEREETERAELALFLHDEVLNPLAALSMQIEPGSASPKYQQNFLSLVTNLREAVAGLRPAMLNYGLYTALAELIDELCERATQGMMISLEMEPSSLRYEPKVEQHLYRIVEQACENALRHASCRQLLVSGQLHPALIELWVRDDGVGLPEGLSMNLNQLLAGRHYGLVGMYERAALVGAELSIDSSPHKGTSIYLKWRPPPS